MIGDPGEKCQHVEALLDAGRESDARISLDASLIELHGSGDSAQLCHLHLLAADLLGRDQGDTAPPMFHLTHALVYALEAGDWPLVKALEGELHAAGRF